MTGASPLGAVTRTVAMLLMLAPTLAHAQTADSKPSLASGPLDGMSFAGVFGPENGRDDRDDVLYFDDGQFWSEKCVACGFKPGPYWVRFDDAAVHFRGELESDDRGRFTYTGVVRDERISVRINWRLDRWYWTIDKDFRFEGTLAATPQTIAAERAMRVALAAEASPDSCNP
jgi:hypothetical protein